MRRVADRTKPNKAKKPPVPKHNDAPVMGLKSQKNFIKGNAIAAMTLQPTQREELGKFRATTGPFHTSAMPAPFFSVGLSTQ